VLAGRSTCCEARQAVTGSAGMVRALQKTMLSSVAHFAKVYASLLGHENAKKKKVAKKRIELVTYRYYL
jgi:hypothetical protein